jgi:hypothetical protein
MAEGGLVKRPMMKTKGGFDSTHKVGACLSPFASAWLVRAF